MIAYAGPADLALAGAMLVGFTGWVVSCFVRAWRETR